MVLPISSRFQEIVRQDGYSRLSNQAVGLLETRGFPGLVGACDAMLKAAEVQLAAYVKTGDALCTAIVRGKVANVVVALDVGMLEAERIGELHGVMVIPRPLDELEQTLPTASHWIEEPLDMYAYDEQAELCRRSAVPIAGGELNGGWQEFKVMLEKGSYDIYQPDVTMGGGITDALKVLQACQEKGLGYTPHTWTNGLGFLINLHVYAAGP